jgi:hypothetical protein
LSAQEDFERADYLLATLASRLRSGGEAGAPLDAYRFGRLQARREAARALAAIKKADQEASAFARDLAGEIQHFLPNTPSGGTADTSKDYQAIGYRYLVEGRAL